MHRIRPFPLLLIALLAGAAAWIGGCSAPRKPLGSTSGGWNTYASEKQEARIAPLPPPSAEILLRLARAPVPAEASPFQPVEDLLEAAGAGTEADDKAEAEPMVGAEPEEEAPSPVRAEPETAPPLPPRRPKNGGPRTRGLTMPGGTMPVRMQIGPKPVVLEAGRMEAGDDILIVVREYETGKVVLEQEFTWTKATLRLASPPEEGGATGAGRSTWQPEPGTYIIEIWSRRGQVGEKTIKVD